MFNAGGISNVVKFRKAGTAPRVDCAENGGRGDIKLAALPTSHFPQNPHTDGFAPDGFEPLESHREFFVVGDPLDSARGVYAWVGIMFAVECALGLFGWWAVT